MSTYPDLRAVTEAADWFLTITVPTPSSLDDAQARFELEWRNARRLLSGRWTDEDLADLDAVVGARRHDEGRSLVIVRGSDGSTLVETLDEPCAQATAHEGPLPRWIPVIAARQRAIAHVVVEADRTGADVTALDGGTVLETENVEGSTLHIHRGHPGGWSQRRFQQRAENRWESNARLVSEAVATLARKVDAQLVAVAGDIRAQMFILESLPSDVRDVAVRIEAGSPDGVANEVERLLSGIVADRVAAASEVVAAGLSSSTATVDPATILDALRAGRVETLLVTRGAGDEEDGREQGPPQDGRLVDRAIAAALATDADVLVAPEGAVEDRSLAASLRW